MSQALLEIIKNKVFKEEEIQAVSFQSADEKVSWIFDFKNVVLSQVFLKEFARLFWDRFGELGYNTIQLGGMESGAIPLIVGLSVYAPPSVTVNSFYIRKSRKKSDLANMIEGDVQPGIPIVLIDDIINNGNTIKKQIAILEERGHAVDAIFTCLRYRDVSAYQELTDKGIRIENIFELNDLSGSLPVKNLAIPQEETGTQKYRVDYKVSLTKHPNLYAVVPKSGPILSGDFIFMGSDDGAFYCLNKEDGSVVWTYKVPFGAGGKRIFSTCVLHDGHVIFGAYDGNLYCLDANTGKKVWVFMDADWIGSSPCVDASRGIVFVGLEFGLFKKQGGVVAIDIQTGKALWKNYSMKGLTHASPAYNKKHDIVVCGCNDNAVYAFDAKSGEIVWKYETEGEVKYGAVFDDARDLVLIGGMDGGLHALSIQNGTLFYRFEARAGFYSTPIVKEGFAYIGSLDRRVYCFNLDEKKTTWTADTRGRIFASPLSDGNSIFIGSNDGCLYELDAKTGKTLSTIQLTERIVNRIQLERAEKERVLYVPTHTCELYRIKLPTI